ncbi:MAG: UPF0182 family protein [Clostridia bacterium]|nr:UPF0182 family protein [Clostridia bacterium]
MNQNFSGFNGFDTHDKDFKKAYSGNQFKMKKSWVIALVILVLILAALGSSFGLVMDYWQLQEIGQAYTSIFWTDLSARVLTLAIGVCLVFAVLLCNVFLLKRFAVVKTFQAGFFRKKWPYTLLSLALALFFSNLFGGDLYRQLLMAANAESFGISDPLFSQDIGYYIFTRPFLMSLASGGKSLVILLLILAIAVYLLVFVKKGHRSLKEVIKEEKGAVLHVASLAIIYFLLSVLTYRFSAENVMYSSFGAQNEIFGAGYIEANIWRQYYRFAPILVIATICLILFFLYKKKYLFSLCSVLIVPALFFLVSLIAFGVDALVVSPNERNLQTPYIAHNMEATSQAFGLSDITEQEFTPRYDVSQSAIAEDETWLSGTRITDFGATLTAYNQLQFLRKYYAFHDVDVVPYELNGKLNVVFLAAREMNKENLDESAKSYANQIFRYTHGFGAVASPVNRVTNEGQPEFLIKDIPPKSTGDMPEITRPRIYYGELTNDYVIVGGNNKELDYSEGLEDIEFTFDGDTGVTLSFMKRLMFSAYYGDYRMLFSGNINSDSKILINRNVLKRINRVAPFFGYDDDPYLVISDDGKLYWIVNGYTTSGYYPYSQPYGGVNYIRNSVMATVDAYTGDVMFYLTDESDPIAKCYRKIYPALFAEGAIPETIRNHIRVPEYLFKLQTEIYQRYHVKDAGQFYDRADVWDIAREKYQTEEIAMEPYYNIMKIDGKDEMVLMRPFVVSGKHNMVGLLVQRNDATHYGELMLYRFPKNETVYGPLQIENRIDNDPAISREMTLWGQGGSSVIRGNLLVVPYRNSLLYVEPIYLTSQNNASLPELKRIVVAYGDAVAMEPTLEAALRSVFTAGEGGSAIYEDAENEPSPPDGETQNLEAAIQSVLDAYDGVKASMQNQDWQGVGTSMGQLEAEMEKLRQQNNKE